MRKKIVLTLTLISITLTTVFAANYDFRDTDLNEGSTTTNGTVVIMTTLPARLVYTPEAITYFKADDTGYMNGKAVAKLGTLTLEGFDNSYESTIYDKATLNAIVGSTTFIYQLYMQSGTNSAYNKLSNETTLSYVDQNGKSGTLDVYLASIAHYTTGTIFTKLSYSTNSNWVTKNPSILGSSGYPTFKQGDYVEFYLVTKQAYNSSLQLTDSNRGILKEPNFRDMTKWSYRLDKNSRNRYETAGSDRSGWGPFNNDVRLNGICYNVPPEVVVPTQWNFTLEPTSLAENLDSTVNTPQVIANAKLTPDNDFSSKPFSVIYSFSSTKNTGSSFYMSNGKAPNSVIPYSLSFTPHTGFIEKDKEYIWYVDSTSSQNAELKVHDLFAGAQNALSGLWFDTIIITVTATDNLYTSST